jgi:tetratricopeptide (TPR) repeat protein
LAALASCSSPQAEIKVRSATSSPQVKGLGEAEAQLVAGNVGLALEAFRQVLRDNPGNVAAAVGIAHCYDQMGRPDLSGRWFETALASAPENTTILNDFAASLEKQGKLNDAASVRAEAARLNAGTARPAVNLSADALTPGADAAALSSVTVTLPAPAPARRPDSAGKQNDTPAIAAAVEAKQRGPRLERLSLGEVALITTPMPIWKGEVVQQSAQSVTFRWTAVRPLARLLNAARTEGLAARTRQKLEAKGWKKIEIGDAPAVRASTLVLYPEYRWKTARKLASQFGFTHLQAFSGSEIVVLLGRDAAALKGLRPT